MKRKRLGYRETSKGSGEGEKKGRWYYYLALPPPPPPPLHREMLGGGKDRVCRQLSEEMGKRGEGKGGKKLYRKRLSPSLSLRERERERERELAVGVSGRFRLALQREIFYDSARSSRRRKVSFFSPPPLSSPTLKRLTAKQELKEKRKKNTPVTYTAFFSFTEVGIHAECCHFVIIIAKNQNFSFPLFLFWHH